MRTSLWTWLLLGGAGSLVALCLGSDVNAADPPAKKPTVIQIDLDKLPPDVAKRLLELSQSAPQKKGQPTEAKKKAPEAKAAPKKTAVKSITLAQALAIAEKAGKGEAVRARRKTEDGKVEFRIDVVAADGTKTKIRLDASGEVSASESEKKEEGKKEKKKEGTPPGPAKQKDKAKAEASKEEGQKGETSRKGEGKKKSKEND